MSCARGGVTATPSASLKTARPYTVADQVLLGVVVILAALLGAAAAAAREHHVGRDPDAADRRAARRRERRGREHERAAVAHVDRRLRGALAERAARWSDDDRRAVVLRREGSGRRAVLTPAVVDR